MQHDLLLSQHAHLQNSKRSNHQAAMHLQMHEVFNCSSYLMVQTVRDHEVSQVMYAKFIRWHELNDKKTANSSAPPPAHNNTRQPPTASTSTATTACSKPLQYDHTFQQAARHTHTRFCYCSNIQGLINNDAQPMTGPLPCLARLPPPTC
jgi:hypothetical protein